MHKTHNVLGKDKNIGNHGYTDNSILWIYQF